MASLKLEHVKKVYDKNVVAVHDFNLEIQDKEFIVFVQWVKIIIKMSTTEYIPTNANPMNTKLSTN